MKYIPLLPLLLALSSCTYPCKPQECSDFLAHAAHPITVVSTYRHAGWNEITGLDSIVLRDGKGVIASFTGEDPIAYGLAESTKAGQVLVP